MDFTITINDALVPRIVTAFNLQGTNAQKKAAMEAWVKAQIKAQVKADEASKAGQAKAADVEAEVW